MAETALFRDLQSSGVNGTQITTTRARQPLNDTLWNDIAGASLSGNQITLPEGRFVLVICDHFKSSNAGYGPRYYIKNAAGTTLETHQGSFGLSTATPDITVNATMFVDLASSTAIELWSATEFGTMSREARSDGLEVHQKVLVQKVG